MKPSSAITTAIGVVISLAAVAAVAQDGPAYEPGVLIVKYADSVSDSAQRIIASGGFSAFFAGTSSDSESGLVPGATLDDIHDEIGLTEIKSTFLERSELTTTEARANELAYYANVLERFPERSGRRDPEAAFPDRTNNYVLHFSPDVDVVELATRYSADPAVEWATPNYTAEALTCPRSLPTCSYFSVSPAPADPYLTLCASHGITGLEDAWGQFQSEAFDALCTATGDGVIVAIIDTGVDYRFPDITPNLWINPDEDTNSNGKFEPWSSATQKRLCEGGESYRRNCTSNADCDGSDVCGSVLSGDFNGTDNGSNGYVDDVIGYDINTPDADPFDDQTIGWASVTGHGTMVSSIVVAAANDLGMIGYAPDARLMTLRILADGSEQQATDVAAAIDYAVANGASVINMSFKVTNDAYGDVNDALDAAWAAGLVLVAATGNDGTSTIAFPASHNRVLAVGGSTPDDEKWTWANYGSNLDVVAPAGRNPPDGIRDQDSAAVVVGYFDGAYFGYPSLAYTYSGEYVEYAPIDGTSFASPAAVGMAASLISGQADLTNQMVIHALRGTATDIEDLGTDNLTGKGRINGRRAMSLLTNLPGGTVRGALPVEALKGATPYSVLDTGGSPADTIEFWGQFHKPISWDISPIGKQVTIRIQDKNGQYEVAAVIPATHATCNGPSLQCFEAVANPNGYEFKDLSQPQHGIQEVHMTIKDIDERIWELKIKGKAMNQHADWDNLWAAEDRELIWSVEIDDRVTLRSNVTYIESGTKLKHPK